jgi:hypothetical protein
MHLKKPSFRRTDFSPGWTHKSNPLPNFGVNNPSAELDRLPKIPITFSICSSLGTRVVNPAGTARHHSGHRVVPPSAATAPQSTTSPGILGLPRSRRPARLAITAVPEIAPAPEKPENPTKIPFSFPPNFS